MSLLSREGTLNEGVREMARKKTAVAAKKAQVQALQAQAPKTEKAPKSPALAILKAANEQTLATIVKALNGAFTVSEPKTGGSWFRVRLYAR